METRHPATFGKVCSIALILFAAITFSTLQPANAEIYTFQDNEGTLHLTDKPKMKGFNKIPKWKYSAWGGRFTAAQEAKTKHRRKSGDPSKYTAYISAASAKHQVDSKLIHAVISVESDYDPSAVSSRGAMGLMQLMPDTARRFNVTSPFDPQENIDAGTRYLRILLDMFDNKLELALAGYNAGENAVKKYAGIPPYKETKGYVKSVLKEYGSASVNLAGTEPAGGIVEAAYNAPSSASVTSKKTGTKNSNLQPANSTHVIRYYETKSGAIVFTDHQGPSGP